MSPGGGVFRRSGARPVEYHSFMTKEGHLVMCNNVAGPWTSCFVGYVRQKDRQMPRPLAILPPRSYFLSLKRFMEVRNSK